jgi:hypothetical protein
MLKIYQNILFILLSLVVLLQTVPARALPKAVAFVRKASGDAEYLKFQNDRWKPLKTGDRLNSGDRIRTGEGSLVAIVFTDDKSMMKIRSYSDVTIKTKQTPTNVSKRVFAQFGELWFKVKSGGNQFALETPTGIAAVKGTEFYAVVDKDGNTRIIGIEGIVELITQAGRALLNAGNTGTLTSGDDPQVDESDPKDIPDWAGDSSNEKILEMEFQDQRGNKKKLQIKFK